MGLTRLKMNYTPDQSSTLLSLNGMWPEIAPQLPPGLGTGDIVEIGKGYVHFNHKGDTYEVRIQYRTVTKLSKIIELRNG